MMPEKMNESISIVLASNFLNHHMLPLCIELNKLTHGNFKFIATTEVPEERVSLGYKKLNKEYDFVIRAYENIDEKKRARQLCFECDILIYGSAPESYYLKRLLHHKLTFRYSERVLKNIFTMHNLPKYIGKYLIRDVFTQNRNHFLLAASAYASDDFNRFGAFKGRSLKWGYFPPTSDKNICTRGGFTSPQILWVGRLISYKKPYLAIEVAKELKRKSIPFQMIIIGTGELENEMARLVDKNGLEDCVNLVGAKPNSEVREMMQKSDVFLFTSNEEEGWGAVLNEAMDSGCACIAYKGIGAVPFLIEDGLNGFVYEEHSGLQIARIIEKLIADPTLVKNVDQSAKKTISELWNAEVAAKRLVEFSICTLQGRKMTYETGPLSNAIRLKCNAKE